MSDLLEAALLGVVQGLTEFLPVSSTGHLVIVEDALGVSEEEFGLRFDAAIHLGTLAAVLVYFRTMLAPLFTGWLLSVRQRRWDVSEQSRLAWLLILGTIPAGIIGFLLEGTIEENLRSPAVVGAMLILFCLPMVAAERYGRHQRVLADATPVDALVLGVAQSVALIPGVSRSGITISAGMGAGFQRPEAAVFAFLLSGPIIAAAGGKQVFDILRGEGGTPAGDLGVYLVGLVTAAIVGYAAIAFLVRFLRSNPLHIFIAYRLVLGVIVLGLAATGVL
jgi:undecaprenyl-diphosphatase